MVKCYTNIVNDVGTLLCENSIYIYIASFTQFGNKWGGITRDVLGKKVFEDVLPVRILRVPSSKMWTNSRVALWHSLSCSMHTAIQ